MELGEKAILRALLYADIFNYPLTQEEIWKNLISEKEVSRSSFDKSLSKLLFKKVIFKSKIYISVNPNNLQNRDNNNSLLADKLEKARLASNILSGIEGIEMVGLSGGLAAGNAREDEDIDFFIVAEKKYLWTVRLECTRTLHKHGIRRSRSDTKANDKICLNMFVAREHLGFSEDIYTAHEITQLIPLFSRGKVYEDFIQQNKWVYKYMPNFCIKEPLQRGKNYSKRPQGILYSGLSMLFLEAIQRAYMFPHKTTEKISGKILAFHPFDYKKFILENYEERIRRYAL